MSRINAVFSLVFCLLIAQGCGSSGPAMQKVSGKVTTQQGNPCDNALIVFHPQEPDRLNDPKPFAKTDAQGEFQLTTHAEGDGALAGKYGITIVWQGAVKEAKFSLSGEGQGSGTDKLNGKYANPAKPLLIEEVKSGTENRFELKVEQ